MFQNSINFPAGLTRCAMGGGFGLGIAALYCLYTASTSGSKINFNKPYM